MAAVVGIIPARFHSTRFEGKVLAPLAGKPLIQHVYERAQGARCLERVLVATDDERIVRAVEAFGGEAVMTSPEHPSGTDRAAEVARGLEAEIVVNIQGDEPLIRPEMIEAAVAPLEADPAVVMGTLMCRLKDPAELADPNVTKVVVDREGFALYFSRSPLPYPGLSGLDEGPFFRHVGLYVYRKDFLLTFSQLEPTPLERTERLEQLRALENGYRIKVTLCDYLPAGVDTPEDLERVRRLLEPTSPRSGYEG